MTIESGYSAGVYFVSEFNLREAKASEIVCCVVEDCVPEPVLRDMVHKMMSDRRRPYLCYAENGSQCEGCLSQRLVLC
jgi:hypothetical protein